MNNLGTLYQRLGDGPRAESHLRRAMQIYGRALGDKSLPVSYSLNNLGSLCSAMGRIAEARSLLTEALAIRRAKLGDGHPLVATTLANLSVTEAQAGDFRAALAIAIEAGVVQDRLIGQVFSIGSERQRMECLRVIGDVTPIILSLVRRHFACDPNAVGRAFDLVLRRKGIELEALATQRDAVLAGRSVQLRTLLRQLARLRETIAAQMMTGPGADGLVAHERRLAQWVAAREEIETALARRIPEMNLERLQRAADRSAIAAALPANAALVEIVRFADIDFGSSASFPAALAKGERYVAFIVRRGAAKAVNLVDVGNAADIDGLVSTYLSVAADGRYPGARLRSEGRAGGLLRAAVFDPLRDAFGGRRRLLVSADGELLRVPLGALPTEDGRLLDEFEISYVGTGRDLLRLNVAGTRRPRTPLVVADPDFELRPRREGAPGGVTRGLATRVSPDARSTGPFDALKGTEREGKAVASLLGARRLGKGQARTRVVRRCQAPWIMHIATHGFFLPNPAHGEKLFGRFSTAKLENPLLRSGLALAGANTWLTGGTPPESADCGLLTAEDVSGMNLLGTEMVVLSACETGLGEIRCGEGVFGLRRAFVVAGARSLVMSLWKVPDDATRALMEAFYLHLLAGATRADALRAAQRSVREQYRSPYYWGAFILEGDPGPLRPRASFVRPRI